LRPLREKFEELEDLLLHHRRQLAQSTGVPFVRLVYHVDEEQAAQRQQRVLARTLRKKGVPVREVSCRGVIFTHYEDRERLEQLFELERRDEQGLKRNITKHAKRTLKQRLLEAAKALPEQGVLFLVDVAFIHPYFELGGVLEPCINHIRAPQALVIFYPADYDATGQLLFLGQRPSGYYRARPLI
jgi:hypothetical protein